MCEIQITFSLRLIPQKNIPANCLLLIMDVKPLYMNNANSGVSSVIKIIKVNQKNTLPQR